jgi:hypothetical protein
MLNLPRTLTTILHHYALIVVIKPKELAVAMFVVPVDQLLVVAKK